MRNEVGETSFYYRRGVEKWNPFICCARGTTVAKSVHNSELKAFPNNKSPFLYSSSPSHILRMSLAFSLLLPLLHVWGLHLTSQVLSHLASLHPEPRYSLSDVISCLSLASPLVSILVQLSSQGTCWYYFQSVLSPWYLWIFLLLFFFFSIWLPAPKASLVLQGQQMPPNCQNQ